MSGAEPVGRLSSPPPADPVARRDTFAEIDITAELDLRPQRSPDYEREHCAFAVLAAELAANPRNMLEKLVEIALDLCHAPTAGISLLDGDSFRWVAVAGVLAHARGSTVPKDECPCGVCLSRDATLLMHLPDRSYPALAVQPRIVEALVIPFHAQGKPVGTLWVATQVSDRKFDREDERILRVLAEFASSGWQLWKAYEGAEEASRRKDAFIAMLGHELRNPLSAMGAATSVLKNVVRDGPIVAQAIDVIARQCRHVSRLADDLLDVGRIGSGNLPLDIEILDLRGLVVDAVDMCRPRIESRGIDLEVQLTDEAVWVDGDAIRLTQVFGNIIDNAVKYTPAGGLISVRLNVERGHVRLAVSDTGCGIPAAQLDRIFDPFTQLAESRNSSAGGIGLGLSLVRSLAELHGGSVTALSGGPGQGSCFTVQLPFKPTYPHGVEPAPS